MTSAILRSGQMNAIFFVLALVAFPGGAEGQEPSVPDWATEVDSIANRALTNHTAGISIAVARDGKVILARGYGYANIEHSVPVTLDTPFHICSISKNIEAAILLQLVEQGKLSLDDDIRKYIPDVPVHGQKVTVAQLLNHTSGIFQLHLAPRCGRKRAARSYAPAGPGADSKKTARLQSRFELALQ